MCTRHKVGRHLRRSGTRRAVRPGICSDEAKLVFVIERSGNVHGEKHRRNLTDHVPSLLRIPPGKEERADADMLGSATMKILLTEWVREWRGTRPQLLQPAALPLNDDKILFALVVSVGNG